MHSDGTMTEQLHLWPSDRAADGLTWSISRDRRFRDCLRRYYLHHYGSRGGWQPDAAPEVRELYVLKQLSNRYMWVGSVVHEMVELVLSSWRRGDKVQVQSVVERGTRRMRSQYAESLQKIYRDRPGRAFALAEHEYGEEISRAEWQRQRDHMESCLHNFFASPVAKSIGEIPVWRWLALESMGSFELDGATVLVRPDFAWRDESERVVLVDWKTGKSTRTADERQQLSVYGLFARRSWGLRAESLRGIIARLSDGTVQEYEIGPQDLDEAEETARRSLTRMRELDEASSAGEQPVHFPMTENQETCSRCVFRRVCARP